MRYENVCLETIAFTLPEEVVTSEQLEGRLELMSGIRERRFWAPGTLPSEKSVETAERALAMAGIDRSQVGALVHGSVCRDHLEPATACRVHHGLGLGSHCTIY